MDINTAIIINDQYNNTLVAIENLLEHIEKVDIPSWAIPEQLEDDLATLASAIENKKHTLIKDIEL